MDPSTGTFLSVDPVVADYADPQSLNAYAYARNNPVRYTDPTGLLPFEEIIVYAQPGATLDVSSANLITSTFPTAAHLVAGNFIAGPAHVIAAEFGHITSIAGFNEDGMYEVTVRVQPLADPSQRDGDGGVVVDSTAEAVGHYFKGNGEPATLGPETQEAIKNSPDQQDRAERIRTGQTSDINRGNYGVDVTGEKYFVGDTPVHYRTACGGGICTTTFTSRGDGFWDVGYGDFDGPGPRGEVPGGTPYPFRPFSWQMTFTDPRARP